MIIWDINDSEATEQELDLVSKVKVCVAVVKLKFPYVKIPYKKFNVWNFKTRMFDGYVWYGKGSLKISNAMLGYPLSSVMDHFAEYLDHRGIISSSDMYKLLELAEAWEQQGK